MTYGCSVSISRQQLLTVTVEAGELAQRSFRSLSAEQVAYKSEIDLVTEIDHSVQSLLIDRLARMCPGARVLAEEQQEHRALTDEPTFIIDPVDGTTNFVHGVPHYCVSVAYAEQGEPVLGVVSAPALGEVFSSERGGGSFRNAERIKVSPNSDPRRALGCTGLFGDSRAGRAAAAELMGRALDHLRDIRRMGAAALDLCYVACGRFDLFWERGLNAWDIAAGMLIVREAGGRVSDAHGDTEGIMLSGSIVAANPQLHRWFMETVLQG